jgi:GNAT superfamily N-acetyltransferase
MSSVARDRSPLAGIRTARADEGSRLREIHRRASYIWSEDRADLDANPQVFGADAASIAAGRVCVAVDRAGILLGFAAWRPAGKDAELDDLFVEPDSMRHGIGSALVADAASRAHEAGLERILVVAHPRTLAFYRRAGFIEQGPATTEFGPALRLARELRT